VELSSFESENDYKEEKISTFVENITPLILQGSITDDNPSPSNGLTGLEQVILFEVEPYMDEIYNMKLIKALITVHKALLEREAEELLSGKDEEWEEDIEPDYEDIYYRIDDREFKKKIRQIAIGYERGIYTDDNQSQNGLTGIGQIISYVAELLYPNTIREKRSYSEQIKKMIRGYILDFRGGSRMSLFGEDLYITIDD